jgi:hypothetical protein
LGPRAHSLNRNNFLLFLTAQVRTFPLHQTGLTPTASNERRSISRATNSEEKMITYIKIERKKYESSPTYSASCEV